MSVHVRHRSARGTDLFVVELGRDAVRDTSLHFTAGAAFAVLDRRLGRPWERASIEAANALRALGRGGLAALLQRAGRSYMTLHSTAVAELARHIARRLGLGSGEVRRVAQVAALHDLGKILVRSAVIAKPGRLTPEERREIEEHPALGAALLRAAGFPEDVSRAVETHHERLDGAGYPGGLPASRIPLAARIVAAADAFDVMTRPRGYGRTRDVDGALAELERCAGTQFDPVCVGALCGATRERLASHAAAAATERRLGSLLPTSHRGSPGVARPWPRLALAG